jgi:molybdenum cofactor synthesis domain-containing protein
MSPGAARPRAVVVTASNRAAAGVYADTGGPLIVDALREWGFEVDEPLVVPDGEPVERALRGAVEDGVSAVVTTGGTGVSPTDETPERTRAVLAYEIPGLAEAIRAYGVDHGVPTAMLSRGLAGVAGRTVIVNLPGSRGGVRDGLAVLHDVLPHAVDQVRGGDHAREAEPGATGETAGVTGTDPTAQEGGQP